MYRSSLTIMCLSTMLCVLWTGSVLTAPNTRSKINNNTDTEKFLLIDQSQNGTSNFRISVKDVAVIVGRPALYYMMEIFLDLLKVAVVDVNDKNGVIMSGDQTN